MQFITCGLPKLPTELTKSGIFALASYEKDKIRDKLFAV